MRRPMRSVAAAIGAAWLAGCSTVPSKDMASRGSVVDQTRVAAVERLAARTGTRVYWINPPTKPTTP